jgi:hypothetical protein
MKFVAALLFSYVYFMMFAVVIILAAVNNVSVPGVIMIYLGTTVLVWALLRLIRRDTIQKIA